LVSVAGALACAPLLGLPAAAEARWGRPVQLAPPGTLDVVAPQVAVASSGAAAAAFGIEDVDAPGSSQGYLSLRSAGGAAGRPLAVAGTSQILALAYDGGTLELLTGTAAAGESCCSSAQAIAVSAGGRAGKPRTLVGGLTGDAAGRLLTLSDGQMLATVATERGVWVVQSSRGNRFGAQHLLTSAGEMPEALATAWLGGENTVVAWTAATGVAGEARPRSIDISGGTRTRPPHRVAVAVTVPAGHTIDELGLAPRGGGATAAWIESWYDRGGAYHSQVRAMDVAPHAAVRTLSAAGRLASGLSFDGDLAGDQAASWNLCSVAAQCVTQVATRAAHGSFGGARTLGGVDAAQSPALTVGPQGQVLAGWIQGGRPWASVAPRLGRGFGVATSLSSTTYASDLTIGFGPKRSALAAWTEGTLNPSVVGVSYSP
jgi:hypothetical protein